MKPSLDHFMQLLAENIQGLDSENLTPDTRYKDADGWSSMNALLIMALLEREFGVSVKVEQLRQCQTVRDLHEIL